jgi:hypothetical protein
VKPHFSCSLYLWSNFFLPEIPRRGYVLRRLSANFELSVAQICPTSLLEHCFEHSVPSSRHMLVTPSLKIQKMRMGSLKRHRPKARKKQSQNGV